MAHISSIELRQKKILGRKLNTDEVVHHKNENKQDYSDSNLEVLPNQSAHIKIHIVGMLEKRKEKHGY